MSTESRTVQVFPSGRMYHVRGQYPEFQIAENRSDEFRPATPQETVAIQAQELAQVYADRDILCCDSHLIDSLARLDDSGTLHGDDMSGAWGIDQWENVYRNPDDWSLEECRDYLEGYGGELPDPNPWSMDRLSLVELLESIDFETDDNLRNMSEDELRAAVAGSIDIGSLDGLEEWQDACREIAQDNPADVMEWWRVSSWLCRALRESGEVIIDNDYGCWWGRACTGQGYIMDGTLQEIAQRYLSM